MNDRSTGSLSESKAVDIVADGSIAVVVAIVVAGRGDEAGIALKHPHLAPVRAGSQQLAVRAENLIVIFHARDVPQSMYKEKFI